MLKFLNFIFDGIVPKIAPLIGAIIATPISMILLAVIWGLPCGLLEAIGFHPMLLFPSEFGTGFISGLIFVCWFQFWNSKRVRKELMEGWAFCERH